MFCIWIVFLICICGVSASRDGSYQQRKLADYEYSDVVWTALKNNAQVTGTTGGLDSSAGVGNADSTAEISSTDEPRVGVRFSGLTGDNTHVGLACGSEMHSNYLLPSPDCYFAILRNSNGNLKAREPGRSMNMGLVRPNFATDVFEVRLRDDGKVQYLRNGEVFTTSSNPMPSFPIRAHVASDEGSVGSVQWVTEVPPPTGQPTGQPTSGLALGVAGHYTFNGNADDASGGGNHGVVSGATLAVDRWGNADGCYYFDGSSSYIEVVNGTAFDFTDSFSVSLWIKGPIPQTPSATLISKSHRMPVRKSWLVEAKANQGSALVLTNRVSGAWAHSNSVDIAADQWFHFVAVKQGSTYHVYSNGALVSSINGPAGAIESNGAAPLYFGSHLNPDGFGYFYEGLLDDIRLYDRALSSQEVAQLHAEESTPPAPTGQPTSYPSAAPTGQPTSYPSAFSSAVMCDPTARCYWPQQGALVEGLSEKDAAKFSSIIQLTALQHGMSPRLALKFESQQQLKALKAGVGPETALRFTSWMQLAALEQGLPVEQALQFTHWVKVRALEQGVTVAEALQFSKWRQLSALQGGATVTVALQAV